MVKIKYSIIIPHKNIPHLLSRCLASIPICPEIEVIIVDDDSDPEKVDFEYFPGSDRCYTQIIFTKEGKGAGYARNVGLRHAKAKWLIFADSDDYFNDCFFSSIEKFYDSNADLVYFSATSVDSETLEPATRHTELSNAIYDYDINNPKSIETIKYYNWEPWSKMFNHAHIKENRIFFDEVAVGNDAGFVITAGHFSQIIEVDKEPIYCVTHRTDSLTHEVSETAFDDRYLAVLLVNGYLRRFDREQMIPVFPLISRSIKFGALKFFTMLFMALKSGENIFYGSKKYIEYLFRSRHRAIRKYFDIDEDLSL